MKHAILPVLLVLPVLPVLASRYGSLDASSNLVEAPYTVRVAIEYITNVVETATATNIVVYTNSVYSVTASLPETTANALGYKLVTDTRPVTDTNHYAVATGWAETNRIYRLYEVRELPPTYRAWTPLTIMRGAKSQGFWAAMKAVLDANDAYDEFMACQYCAECDPAFVSIRAIIVAQIGEEATTAFLNSLKVEKTGTREELLEMAH